MKKLIIALIVVFTIISVSVITYYEFGEKEPVHYESMMI